MIKVTVLEIVGGQVKLGFEADRSVPIHRWEVWERIRHSEPPANPAAPVV
jgi:carbon storage regulator CsrA